METKRGRKYMKIGRVVLLISLFLNLVLVSGGSFVIYKKGGLNYIAKKVPHAINNEDFSPYYRQKVSTFESVSLEKVDIAFIGDSITDFGEWSELFPNFVVINRGIMSDNTIGVLNRLNEIIEKKPKKIFIMIGINDLNRIDSEKTYSNYSNIIKKIKSSLPNSSVYIQSVLPVNNKIYDSAVDNHIDNKAVKVLNIELEKIAKIEQVKFIDLYSALSNNDQLEEKYTIDGIHLTGAGFAVWKEKINEFVK